MPHESRQEFRIITGKEIPAAMRDGTMLSADVYRTDAEGRFPVILVRPGTSPYGKQLAEVFGDHEYFSSRGYMGIV